jgi:hypothetical protein
MSIDRTNISMAAEPLHVVLVCPTITGPLVKSQPDSGRFHC